MTPIGQGVGELGSCHAGHIGVVVLNQSIDLAPIKLPILATAVDRQ